MASYGKAKLRAAVAENIKEPKSMHLREAAEGGVLAEHDGAPPYHFASHEHKELAAHIKEHFGMDNVEPDEAVEA